MEMEVRPLTERTGMIDLHDENGRFVGKANVGVRIMLADGFYVPERTCRISVERRKLSQTQTALVKTCSECGFKFGVEKENTLPFEVTLNVVVPPNFCPNCGAKVEEER